MTGVRFTAQGEQVRSLFWTAVVLAGCFIAATGVAIIAAVTAHLLGAQDFTCGVWAGMAGVGFWPVMARAVDLAASSTLTEREGE